ncbi:MAG: hemolysin III family protein [Planctomycetota bacterium]
MDRDLIPFLYLQDPLSSVSHLLGSLTLLAALWLVRGVTVGEARRDRGVRVYFLCGGLQLLCSALYHSQPYGTPARIVFWHLDHATIWIALAASFTAVMSTLGRWQPRYHALVWGVAVAGALLELSSLPALNPWISPVLYVAMGWLGFPLWLHTARVHGVWGPPGWLLLGGGLATLGGVIDALEWPTLVARMVEAHEVMHVCIALACWCYVGTFVYAARAARWRQVPAPVPVPVEVNVRA